MNIEQFKHAHDLLRQIKAVEGCMEDIERKGTVVALVDKSGFVMEEFREYLDEAELRVIENAERKALETIKSGVARRLAELEKEFAEL